MPNPSPARNRLAVDIGGTFTDIVIEGARRFTLKVLTTPRAPELAVIEGVLELFETARLKPADIDVFVHGTTLATNAIIERKGAKTALIATEGFRDILDIADESRYNQFDIFIERLKPLTERYLRFTVPSASTRPEKSSSRFKKMQSVCWQGACGRKRSRASLFRSCTPMRTRLTRRASATS